MQVALMHKDPDYKEKQAKGLKEARKNNHTEYDGHIFDSSWEVEVYKKLKNLGIEFRYNESEAIIIGSEEKGGTRSWIPDFDIFTPFGPVHLEVKGDPRAVERWNNVILPELEMVDHVVLLLIAESESEFWKKLESIEQISDLLYICNCINIKGNILGAINE